MTPEMKADLNGLLAHPVESLGVEIKQWFDPSSPEGIAKIAKACLAMRNNNGGKLLIGFTDNGLPDLENELEDPQEAFSVDKIQAIIGKYAHEPFSIEVHFVSHNERIYPVIVVPGGVRYPVAAKSDLSDPKSAGNRLIKTHTVYVRTFKSNNRASSSEATKDDWERIVDHCFENRENDIGAFFRRQLSGFEPGQIASIITRNRSSSIEDTWQQITSHLDGEYNRFRRAIPRDKVEMPQVGFRESIATLNGAFPRKEADQEFLTQLSRIASSRSGLSLWRAIGDRTHKMGDGSPYIKDGGWQSIRSESLDVKSEGGWNAWPRFVYWRLDPNGLFYQLDALADDVSPGSEVSRKDRLDPYLQIARLADFITFGLQAALSLGCDPCSTSVSFAFRWTSLAMRRLSAWAHPQYGYWTDLTAFENRVVSYTKVPLETSISAISPYLREAITPLLQVFDGASFSLAAVENYYQSYLKM